MWTRDTRAPFGVGLSLCLHVARPGVWETRSADGALQVAPLTPTTSARRAPLCGRDVAVRATSRLPGPDDSEKYVVKTAERVWSTLKALVRHVPGLLVWGFVTTPGRWFGGQLERRIVSLGMVAMPA
jgi:hypothetical protein